jgi:hypothetical protein
MDVGHYQNVQLDSTVRDPILGPILWEHPHPRAFSYTLTDFMTSSKKPPNVYGLSPLI